MRFILIILLSFFLTSCATNDDMHTGSITSKEKITSKELEETSLRKEHKYNIALLVQKKEPHGASIIKAAQLAIADSHNADINLNLLDSSLINENKALLINKLQDTKVIIGPVYAAETVKLAQELAGKNITILSLSNDTSFKNDSVLMMGISPQLQTNSLMNYAIGQGINHFYLLLPSNKYGKLISNAAADLILDKNNVNFEVTWYSPETSAEQIDQLVKSIAQTSHKESAIFMPQGGNNLKLLDQALAKHQLKIQLIGSQAWDNANILQFPSFEGAFFLKKDIADQQFFEAYQRNFNAPANNIDAIAYNSLMLIIDMYKNQIAIDKNSIIENNPDKFDSQGIRIYSMPIIKIHNNQFIEN